MFHDQLNYLKKSPKIVLWCQKLTVMFKRNSQITTLYTTVLEPTAPKLQVPHHNHCATVLCTVVKLEKKHYTKIEIVHFTKIKKLVSHSLIYSFVNNTKLKQFFFARNCLMWIIYLCIWAIQDCQILHTFLTV